MAQLKLWRNFITHAIKQLFFGPITSLGSLTFKLPVESLRKFLRKPSESKRNITYLIPFKFRLPLIFASREAKFGWSGFWTLKIEGERNKKGANLRILYWNVCQFERGRKLKGAKYEIFGLGGENYRERKLEADGNWRE